MIKKYKYTQPRQLEPALDKTNDKRLQIAASPAKERKKVEETHQLEKEALPLK